MKSHHTCCPVWLITRIFRGSPPLRAGILLSLTVSTMVTVVYIFSDEAVSQTAPVRREEDSFIFENMKEGKHSYHTSTFPFPGTSLKISEYLTTVFSEVKEESQFTVPYVDSDVKKRFDLLAAERKMSHSRRHRFGVVPVTCDPSKNVSELLRMEPIKFLPEYKNPCWKEPITVPLQELYNDNRFFLQMLNYKKAFASYKEKLLKQKPPPTYRLRCLPYFFLAGQPKCGSTDLYQRLAAHPDIVSLTTKENHWWGKNRHGRILGYKHMIPFSSYVDFFDMAAHVIEKTVKKPTDVTGTRHPVITGDASVSTLWSNDDWWKYEENCGRLEPLYTNAHYIHRLLPMAKIIIILRNPTDRLYSDFLYFQEKRNLKSPEIFHKDVQSAIAFYKHCKEQVGIRACIYNATVAGMTKARINVGFYDLYIQEWLTLFPRKQLFVIKLEDYSIRPLTVMKQLLKFLDLRQLSTEEKEDILEQPKLNTRRQSDQDLGGMFQSTRQILDDYYRPHNTNLAALLDDDRFLWDDNY